MMGQAKTEILELLRDIKAQSDYLRHDIQEIKHLLIKLESTFEQISCLPFGLSGLK